MVFPFLSSSPIVRLLSPIPECGKSLLLQSAIQLKELTIRLESGIPSVEFRVQDRLKLHYMRRLAPLSGSQL